MSTSQGSAAVLRKLSDSTGGDVAIVLDRKSPRYQYRLDHSVLERSSPWFQDVLNHMPEIGSSEQTPNAIRFVFALEGTNDDLPMLVPQVQQMDPELSKASHSDLPKATDSPDDSTPQTPSTIKAEPTDDDVSMSKSGGDNDIYTGYESLFLMFYNRAPRITSTNIRAALRQSEMLVRLAQHYDCLAIIRPHLGHIFHQYRQKLWAAIRNDPPRWANLAIALENVSIFTEALVHMVGCYPKWPWRTAAEDVVDPSVLQSVEMKAKILHDKRLEINHDLFLNMIKVGEGQNEHPVTINDGFETWIIVQMFRDWFAKMLAQLTDPQTEKLDPMRIGSLYRALQKGGDTYMPYDKIHQVLKEQVGGSHDWEEAGDDLRLLKGYAAGCVKEICANNLMLNVEAQNMEGLKIGYLTCADVTVDDLPWMKMATE